MKKEKKKHHWGLTILYSLVIFCILVIAVAISGIVIYMLVHFHVLGKENLYAADVNDIIMYMGLLSVIIGSLTTVLTSEVILKPIKRIIVKLNQLSEGNFKARLDFGFPISKHPTFQELADSFNVMAEELGNTEILRSDFINNFSHEFKTPIVSIAGFAKLLKRGNLTEEQKLEYLDIIEEESMRLSYMATNVLNLSKVENQTILTDTTTFNLSEQIRSSLLLLENRWDKKNIEFGLEFDEYNVDANEELLKQVWINLLDNAIKFSPEYGLIEIKIADAGSKYRVSIANSGVEIPEESRKKIFDKFYQADESHSSEGNGIGLAIVKHIVDLHRGEVSVESKNGITTFVVEIPKKQII